MKILAPCGNMDSLKMAVYNGADEVYLGINSFNARNNIDGFDLDNLSSAVDFAHIFSVKVHLAINILFTDEELQQAVDTIVDSYNIGVDAFIIQDLGLIKIISENYPMIEIHASTQMGIHNLEGVQAIEKYNIKRVVLSRETPLSEIKRIRENSSVEIEYFVQGALCVSFSGNCYMSSYLNSASGNRGKCKQLCRLPYTLKHNGKFIKKGYLLSAKDFNMSDRLKDLEKAGVDAIKIEGRARRPYYVGVATRYYYNALNGLKKDDDQLKLAFNRQFTEGYFNGNGNIISNIQNHIGISVGKVIKVKGGRTFNEVIISSDRELNPKSTFKVIKDNGEQITFSAYDLKKLNDKEYRITTTHQLKVGDKINLIIDYEDEKNILSEKKKRNVDIDLYLKENEPIKAVVKIDDKTFTEYGDICEKAINQPIDERVIYDTFNKGELFTSKPAIIEMDKVFVVRQKLNDLRRKIYDKVRMILTEKRQAKISKIKIQKNGVIKPFTDFIVVRNHDGLAVKSQNIIYSPESYDLNDIEEFNSIALKNNKKLYLDLPVFALKKDIEMLKNIVNTLKIPVIANNYYALTFDTEIVAGGGMNVYNSISAGEYNMFMTAETDNENNIMMPYMTFRHCPVKSHTGCDCKNCKYDENYTYTMDSGKVFLLKRKKLSDCTFYLL